MFEGMAAGIINPMKDKFFDGLIIQKIMAEAKKLKCEPNELMIVVLPVDKYMEIEYHIYRGGKSISKFKPSDLI